MGQVSRNGAYRAIDIQPGTAEHREAVLDAARKAVLEAKRYHKRMGQSIIAMEDGEIVEIPPDEIDVEDPLDKPHQSSGS